MGETLSKADKRFCFLLFWCNLIRCHRHPVPFLNRDVFKVDKIPKAKMEKSLCVLVMQLSSPSLKKPGKEKKKTFFPALS